jgi:hypothetical protein
MIVRGLNIPIEDDKVDYATKLPNQDIQNVLSGSTFKNGIYVVSSTTRMVYLTSLVEAIRLKSGDFYFILGSRTKEIIVQYPASKTLEFRLFNISSPLSIHSFVKSTSPATIKKKLLSDSNPLAAYPFILKRFLAGNISNYEYNSSITVSADLIQQNKEVRSAVYSQLYSYIETNLLDDPNKYLTARDLQFLEWQLKNFGLAALPVTTNTINEFIPDLKKDFMVTEKKLPVEMPTGRVFEQRQLYFTSLLEY